MVKNFIVSTNKESAVEQMIRGFGGKSVFNLFSNSECAWKEYLFVFYYLLIKLIIIKKNKYYFLNLYILNIKNLILK